MKNIDNLKIIPLDIDHVIEWSPAREVWKLFRDDVMSSLWKYVHLSRLLRLSWLWKFGGMYVDTDMLVLKDILTDHMNSSFIGMQNLYPEFAFGSSVIKLSRLKTFH